MGKYSLESYERYKMIKCRPEEDRTPVSGAGFNPFTTLDLRPDERQNLLDDIVVIRFLPRRAPALIAPDVRPGLRVHRIDTEKPDTPALDRLPQRINHTEILKVIAHGILRRKHQNRRPAVPVNTESHALAEPVAVPASIPSFHCLHLMHNNPIYIITFFNHRENPFSFLQCVVHYLIKNKIDDNVFVNLLYMYAETVIRREMHKNE